FAGAALRRLGARGLLTLGLAAEGLRWLLTALSPDLAVVRAAQLLHGVGVAGVLVGGPLYLELSVPSRLRATGQALVATIGIGLASMLSISAAGALFDSMGPKFPYLLSGIGASLLALAVRWRLPQPYRPEARASDILQS
ncbi:MAG: MFS transporter, partial [Acidobacteriota bacterium]